MDDDDDGEKGNKEEEEGEIWRNYLGENKGWWGKDKNKDGEG